uniref:Uncharacterized protein n=1 Tax=Gossypium raimondii TaxID=29730 RepID=A0A0D2RWR4_GOSRA|nr:hypothetical protein B456_012G030400 [Gossypium raimondii]
MMERMERKLDEHKSVFGRQNNQMKVKQERFDFLTSVLSTKNRPKTDQKQSNESDCRPKSKSKPKLTSVLIVGF